MVPMGKDFWRSKTFWFNVLALVVAVAVKFGFGEFVPDEALGQYAAIVVMIVNLILRFVTSEPLHWPGRR